MASSDASCDLGPRQRLDIIEWEHLNLWKFYPMALASSWTVRCFLYPMSVVKSRLQLQKQEAVYRGMRQAFVHIARTEGIGALYRGFWMTLPQLSASFMYSSVYEKCRDTLQVQAGVTSTALVSSLAGGVASTFTQMIFVPTDIIAQHMMVHNNPQAFIGSPKNTSLVDFLAKDGLEKKWTLGLRVARAIFYIDGIKGYYRGYISSLMVYLPLSMVFWSVYYKVLDFFQFAGRLMHSSSQHSISRSDLESEEQTHRKLFLQQAFAGMCGGIAGSIATNPLEIMRIRIQVHRTSYLATVQRLVRIEGRRVFTKGLMPRIINSGTYSCLIMLGYETVKKLCVLPQYKDQVVW